MFIKIIQFNLIIVKQKKKNIIMVSNILKN